MVDPETEQRITLTAEQAIALLPDGDTVHTFRSTTMCLIGADWSRDKLIEALQSGRIEIGGEQCRAVYHGLVLHIDGWLFIETRRDVDWDAVRDDRRSKC